MLARLARLYADRPYRPEAYEFVLRSLEFTINTIGERRHVSGSELLDGIRRMALEEFGPMARHVLNAWGVHASADFGQIVFDLVEGGVLARTEDDDIRDFDEGFDFETAFEKDYYRDHGAFRHRAG